MRLNSIKLSGFKSFAEPTNFELPGQLVGVVGPNGCGKSNIMDAVRWVLGESKASELRGESMQDVIFNGTTTRKAASRSSVELVFDNSDHRAGGQWGQYTEIAVKRVLTREGGSSYYINNQPVRRRDVQDVFLGTGLGPRAYAIIGQGTISRIIESKPEELRLFLEEAAGVSKYKERRRETENRLHDTRENLTRVEDILRELTSNLEKLEKQAEVAQHYTQLQDLGTRRLHQLWYLKRELAAGDQNQLSAETEAARSALEERLSDVRHLESELETLRQSHYAAGDQVNLAQGKLYEATAEVGKLEAEIRFVLENRQRAQLRQEHIAEQLQHWDERQQEAAIESETLSAQDMELEEKLAVVEAQLEEFVMQLPDLDEAVRNAHAKANQQRHTVTQVQQHIQVLAAEQRSIDEQTRQHQQRRERLVAERKALAVPEETQLAQMQSQLQASAEQQEMVQARLQELQDSVPELDAQRAAAQQTLQQESHKVADLTARHEALQALQEKLKSDSKLGPWLEKHGLHTMQQLWTRLQVQVGWENALEAALRERMRALQVSRLEMVQGFVNDAPPAKLSFYVPPAAPMLHSDAGVLPSLLSKLRQHDAALQGLLQDWLQGCYAAESVEQALAARAQLQEGELIFVPQGHAISLHSVDFYAADSEQAGMLARAQEIDNLGKQVRAQQLIQEEARVAAQRAESAYADASQRWGSLRQEAQQHQQAHHSLQVEVLRLTQQAEQMRQRTEQLQADMGEIDALLEALQERRMEAEARFEELDMQLAETQEQHARLEELALEAERKLGNGREQQRSMEREVQETGFARRSVLARAAELQRTMQTADQQKQALQQELVQAQQELQQLMTADGADATLQDALSVKLEREQALAAQRSVYEDLSSKLRASDERRLALERELEPLRQRITDLQLKQQAARIGVEQFAQSLAEAAVDEATLAQSIVDEEIKLSGLQGEIDRIQREIQALGAVNLAAMEELGSARERKTFLDAQTEDLTRAIETLEDAIRKIDGETRELLGSTFETVNGHFGRMFPELFGGGQAKLIMTGDEILDAGVQVMAQPPGKKNQTIHLLSGGEKALTAIALVFAIFQLNPAPFCLLDEVDAPLDDANTERYAKLVSSMSKGTQFLFISHNKIAMEMAEQLIGVTMQEQGVSRIVAVDMHAAVSMAEH